ncbi:hypothetical protein YQE_00602, partial [Dendroctonus ponderosae]
RKFASLFCHKRGSGATAVKVRAYRADNGPIIPKNPQYPCVIVRFTSGQSKKIAASFRALPLLQMKHRKLFATALLIRLDGARHPQADRPGRAHAAHPRPGRVAGDDPHAGRLLRPAPQPHPGGQDRAQGHPGLLLPHHAAGLGADGGGAQRPLPLRRPLLRRDGGRHRLCRRPHVHRRGGRPQDPRLSVQHHLLDDADGRGAGLLRHALCAPLGALPH